jgi:hypothetical protein
LTVPLETSNPYAGRKGQNEIGHRDSSLGVGSQNGIVAFGEDARDRVYAVNLKGEVSRIDPR